VGEVCHRVLENWDYQKKDDLAGHVSRACRVLKQRNPEVHWIPVAQESQKILEKFLSSSLAARLAQCEILGREIPFLYKGPEALMRGSMDLLYRDDGRIWVADYKTDKILPEEAELHAHRYEKQGEVYIEAAQRVLGEKCGFQVIFLDSGEVVNISE